MVQLRLSSDTEKARRLAVSSAVVVGEHVSLAHTHRRVADDLDSQLGADCNPLLIHRLDEATGSIAHTLFIKQEIAARSLDPGRVGHHRNMIIGNSLSSPDGTDLVLARAHQLAAGGDERLDADLTKKVGDLSSGNRQKVGVVQAEWRRQRKGTAAFTDGRGRFEIVPRGYPPKAVNLRVIDAKGHEPPPPTEASNGIIHTLGALPAP